jgi:hypothetical protein
MDVLKEDLVKGNKTVIVLDIKEINCEFVSLTGFITLYKILYRREVKRGKKLKEQKGISQKEFLIIEV